MAERRGAVGSLGRRRPRALADLDVAIRGAGAAALALDPGAARAEPPAADGAAIKLFNLTLLRVKDRYVEPSRVVPVRILHAILDAVQLEVPALALAVTSVETAADHHPIAGTITDDDRVEDVYVLVSNAAAGIRNKKVYYRSNRKAATPARLDFAAPVPLWPGANHVTVVARDAADADADHRRAPVARGRQADARRACCRARSTRSSWRVRRRCHATARGARGAKLSVVVVALLGCWHGRAHAQFPPVTDRAYAIDLYDGVAIGNTTLIGMGGAGAANARGTAGVLLNPSAIAVRSTTDSSSWSIDWHLDVVTATYSSDYDNNGESGSGGASLVTTGLGGRIGDWAVAVTGTVEATPLAGSTLEANATRARVVLAKWFPGPELAIGGGIQTGRLEIGPEDGSTLFSIAGTGLIAGATWVPAQQSYRLAAAIDTSIDGGELEVDGCDPSDCNGYILPEHVRAPWRGVVGGAYRVAPTAWNQQVATPFRDEKALTIAADIVVTGTTSQGYGLEAFGQQTLQRSGRHAVLSLRGGLDYEWKPGKVRLRVGAYWEPGRFEGVGGRFHTTFGGDLRVLAFRLFGPRRVRLSLTGDIASRYRNLGFSIGFWH